MHSESKQIENKNTQKGTVGCLERLSKGKDNKRIAKVNAIAIATMRV
jgi:hypothetical protein